MPNGPALRTNLTPEHRRGQRHLFNICWVEITRIRSLCVELIKSPTVEFPLLHAWDPPESWPHAALCFVDAVYQWRALWRAGSLFPQDGRQSRQTEDRKECLDQCGSSRQGSETQHSGCLLEWLGVFPFATWISVMVSSQTPFAVRKCHPGVWGRVRMEENEICWVLLPCTRHWTRYYIYNLSHLILATASFVVDDLEGFTGLRALYQHFACVTPFTATPGIIVLLCRWGKLTSQKDKVRT